MACTRTSRADAVGGPGVRRALMLALLLTAGFAVVEAIGGWMAGSLALLSDAGHMVTDAAALGLALFANAIGRRPPSQRASYGYGRAEVLAAFINAIVMLAVVAAIVIEAVRRLLDPDAGPRARWCWASRRPDWRSTSPARGCCRARRGRSTRAAR